MRKNTQRYSIYQLSIIFPILFIYMVMILNITLSFSEFKLYIDYITLRRGYVLLSMIWLCCSPLRRSCAGRWEEMLFNIIPPQMLLTLIFAQWHLTTAVLLFLLLAGLELAAAVELIRDAYRYRRRHLLREQGDPDRRFRQNRSIFQRFTLITAFVIFAVPSYMAITVYHLRSPIYTADQGTRKMLGLTAENSEPDSSKEGGENKDGGEDAVYLEHRELLACLSEEKWKTYSTKERITVLQELADMEADVLGIPPVPLATEDLGPVTLGGYNPKENAIAVSVPHMLRMSAEKAVNTVCHEMFHAYQYFLVQSIDWEAEAVQKGPYFEELRQWKANQENYYSYGTGESTFEEYQSQILEETARAYAKEEAEKIIPYIP